MELAGVIWGAGIALLASIAGGLLTSVVGPALSRRAEQQASDRARTRAADDERRSQQRAAIHAVNEGLRLWVEAWGQKKQAEKLAARLDVRRHLVTLRLWTSHEEAIVGELAMQVLTAPTAWDGVNRYGAWDDCVVRWFRGVLAPQDFAAAYVRGVEEAEADQEQQRLLAQIEAQVEDSSQA